MAPTSQPSQQSAKVADFTAEASNNQPTQEQQHQ